ncbi:unnamed protein product [Arctia plantaginis]|uniref:Uncharacterized protein n=1 Tax=Arctia plantaginis TaxID=874455 RepID=A0A8S1B5A2_ARCPL|nr:unnamed protein product [Arctia plantaginis]
MLRCIRRLVVVYLNITVLAHVAQFDGRVQRLAFTTEVSNRNKLQCELQAFPFLKRKTSMGHQASDCRSRSEVKGKATSAATSASSSSGPRQRSDIICFRRSKAGHFATKCPRGNSGGAGAAGGASSSVAVPAAAASNERRVEVCYVSNPSVTLMNTVVGLDPG